METHKLPRIFFLIFVLSLVASCAANIPPVTSYPTKAAVEYKLHKRQGELIVGIQPLTTQEQVIEWFGSDLTKNGLVAFHITVENGRGSSGSVILQTEHIVLRDSEEKPGTVAQTTLPSRDVTSAERSRQAVVGIFAGGMPWEATAVHLRDQASLQNRMRELALRNNTLRPGEKASGFAYFRVQKPWDSNSRMFLVLTLKDSRTGKRIQFNIELQKSELPFLTTSN